MRRGFFLQGEGLNGYPQKLLGLNIYIMNVQHILSLLLIFKICISSIAIALKISKIRRVSNLFSISKKWTHLRFKWIRVTMQLIRIRLYIHVFDDQELKNCTSVKWKDHSIFFYQKNTNIFLLKTSTRTPSKNFFSFFFRFSVTVAFRNPDLPFCADLLINEINYWVFKQS